MYISIKLLIINISYNVIIYIYIIDLIISNLFLCFFIKKKLNFYIFKRPFDDFLLIIYKMNIYIYILLKNSSSHCCDVLFFLKAIFFYTYNKYK